MNDYLTGLLESTTAPAITAVLLGIMTAISPCPLATNITAIGYIGRDLADRRRVFLNGLIYTLGRVVAYSALAVVIYLGVNRFSVSGIFQGYGEKIIGPLLLLFGLLMLDFIPLPGRGLSAITGRFRAESGSRYGDMFLMGILFALAFCPYSGVIYFGMLIPLTVGSASGLLLPPLFAIATAIPVVVFAWLVAYALEGVGTLYKRLRVFEKWFRRVIAFTFIATGLYFIITIYF